jgi:hypothetical protein
LQSWARRLRRPNDGVRALAHADALIAEGRWAEAIDPLTRVHRRGHDVQVAHRLIEARFQAFADTEPCTITPEWPAAVPDLFPGVLIPEVTRTDLTAERLRSAITHHGSLIVRGFAGSSQVTESVTNIERAFSAYDAIAAGTPRPDLDGWYAPFQHDRVSNRPLKRVAGSLLAVDSPPAMCALVDTFEQAGVGRLMRDYFGERPALLARKWSLRRVAHDANSGDWHQDGAFMGQGIRSLNIWLGLTHCGDTAPGIDVVGRRLDGIVETGTAGAHFAWSVSNTVAQAAALGSIVRPVFEAGDAMIFDHLCLHRTAIDPGMTVDRHAIEAWFLAPSTYGIMLGPGTANDAPTDQIPLVY